MRTDFFHNFVMAGDSVTFEDGNFTFEVTLEYDETTTPYDYDCIDKEDINRWEKDEWFYGGLIVSVRYNGVVISDNSVSLWGIECNFSENNPCLNEAVESLLEEAKEEAPRLLEELRARIAA